MSQSVIKLRPVERQPGAAGRHECKESKEPNIVRAPAKGNHDSAWKVTIKRQGQHIARTFVDSVYGSAEAALTEARAYRDAVQAALPSITVREAAVRLSRHNTNGITGVSRRIEDGRAYWVAQLGLRSGPKGKRFSVRKYGERRAMVLAIQQRREWVAEMPPEFHRSISEHTDTVAHRHFPARPDRMPDILRPDEAVPLSKHEIATHLARIDAEFHERRPARIRLRIHCYNNPYPKIGIVVSDAGYPARVKASAKRYGRKPLAEALGNACRAIEKIVADFYTPEIARWFVHEHANHLLDPARFDPNAGLNVLAFVPETLTAAWRARSSGQSRIAESLAEAR